MGTCQVLCDELEQWDGVGEEGSFKREGTDGYLRLTHLLYGRNQHNIVKQLSSS